MTISKTVKTWNKTKTQYLWRHKSGRYYARTWSQGKEIWKSLKTASLSIAKARLGDHLKEHNKSRLVRGSVDSAKMTLGECLQLFRMQVNQDADKVEKTKSYWHTCADVIARTWPDVEKVKVVSITRAQCQMWSEGLLKEKPYRPPKATRSRGDSKDRRYAPRFFNHIMDCLRQTFQIAINHGVIHLNPAVTVKKGEVGIKKRKVKAKSIELPSKEQFQQFVDVIRTSGSRHSKGCAELVQFLAYSGARVMEANNVLWSDIDFGKNTIYLRKTKFGIPRSVPMVEELRMLLGGMRNDRGTGCEDDAVLSIRECQGAMDNSAKRIGIKRITHHDLRHLFATTCIESGVDIPTVSRWLGHKDGGALAMKTYGHLRQEHAQEQVKKIKFGI